MEGIPLMVVGQSTHHTIGRQGRGDWQFFIINHKVQVYYNETKPKEIK